MTLPRNGWKNKSGTSDRSCACGSWRQHWINNCSKEWPKYCSVDGCTNKATLGAHIYNSNAAGEWIAPFCESCNKRNDEFSLKGKTTLVSANKNKTCG